MIIINQEILSENIREFILKGFNEHSTNKIGYNGFVKDQIAFTAQDEGKLIGAISISIFYGVLWIKLLFVDISIAGIKQAVNYLIKL
jgi:hypothetical protein